MADRVRIGTDIDTDADIAAMGVSPSMSTDADAGMVMAMDTVEGAAIPTNLEPEKADTWTAGVVVQSPFDTALLSRLRLSVDWWNIKLNDAIGVQAPDAAHFACLDPAFNPLVNGAAGNAAQATQAATTAACSVIRYDPSPLLAPGTFDVTFLNAGRVDIMGIDGQLDWATEVGPGTLTINALINSFKLVDQLVIMTKGGPNNASSLLLYYIYEVAFTFWDTTYAATLTVTLITILAAVALTKFVYLDRRIHYQ